MRRVNQASGTKQLNLRLGCMPHIKKSSEILRRLQVEELWARRDVLAGPMNAERLKVYVQRRADLAAGRAPLDIASRDKLTTRAATAVPMKHRKSFAPGA
jgi:hypothetical protein